MPIEQSTRGSNMDFRGRDNPDNPDEVDGSAVSRAKEVSQSVSRQINLSGPNSQVDNVKVKHYINLHKCRY